MTVAELIAELRNYSGGDEVRTIAVGESSRETRSTDGADGIVYLYTGGGEDEDD